MVENQLHHPQVTWITIKGHSLLKIKYKKDDDPHSISLNF